jgi:serine/threonine protein kinase
MNINKHGGEVLASGGFGCVFSPALKCIGSQQREKNKISKLMTNKHAKEEYDELKYLNTKLNNIPNYQNYFLINNFTLCRPSKLTKNDLKNFKECGSFKKENITAVNINDSLNQLLAINMPYGGVSLEDFMINNKNYDKLKIMNHKLLELLKNGIIPMNKKHIYHNDIKASNILILTENENMKARLIDWSLTLEYIPFKNNTFPNNWKNRPLQFNLPFSVVLFTDLFLDMYTDFIKTDNATQRDKLYEFMKKYLQLWFKKRGAGHYKYINKIMYMLFKYEILKNNDISDDNIKKLVESNYTLPYIINYLVNVTIHYIKIRPDGSINMRHYLDTNFIKLVDIWGFIISYMPLYELLFINYEILTENQRSLFVNLREMFLQYLYDSHIHPIKLNNLENTIKTLIN